MSKTITISDETYDIIQNFCKELATQDSRSTRMPYIYAIREKKRILGINWEDENHGYEWHSPNDEDDVYDTDDEFIKYLKESGIDEEVDETDLYGEQEWCGFEKVHYVDIRVARNFFLTEKSAQEHIVTHHYHYKDPDIKVIHLHGNYELMNLIVSLNEIK